MKKHVSHRGWLVLISCLLSLCCVASPAWAQQDEIPEGWKSEDVVVRNGTVGAFNGETLSFEVRTRFATLSSSYVRIAISWYDKWAKEDVYQHIITDERFARNEDYTFDWDKPNATMVISYPCPRTRKDKTTVCRETWLWESNTRRFIKKGESSSNPFEDTEGEIARLIRAGKLDDARAQIEAARVRFGKESVDADALFAAFFAIAVDDAYEQFQKKKHSKENARAALKKIYRFLLDPPIQSSRKCPNRSGYIKICLGESDDCGCSDRFGMIDAKDVSWDARFTRIAKILNKADAPGLTLRLLEPVLAELPGNTEVMLALADAYYDTDLKYKAKPLYIRVRQMRLVEKVYIPPYVFDRYKELKDMPEPP